MAAATRTGRARLGDATVGIGRARLVAAASRTGLASLGTATVATGRASLASAATRTRLASLVAVAASTGLAILIARPLLTPRGQPSQRLAPAVASADPRPRAPRRRLLNR
ncbi:hypothetical protein [Thermocatellispora tengchongensis]|uniref:hypothetical protein n=1 Tax=Thermocatellispora tengchongensis TaxID=1073253 RepID=UPI00363CF8E7